MLLHALGVHPWALSMCTDTRGAGVMYRKTLLVSACAAQLRQEGLLRCKGQQCLSLASEGFLHWGNSVTSLESRKMELSRFLCLLGTCVNDDGSC